jgi:TRAP-type uncharacterized transport system substrate-binding protein
MRIGIDKRFLRTPIGIVLLAVTAAVLLWTVFAMLRPLPARDLAMATGPAGSDYARTAEHYRQILARDGVRLRLVSTNGAIDNLRLLKDPRSGIEAAWVQAGTIREADAQDLVSLGTVFYQEAWLFCRARDPLPPPSQWDGWRISIGPEGSASRPLGLKLLALNGVDATKLHLEGYPPEQAQRALLANELDAALIVSGWDSPVVQTLARAPEIRLLGFPRADAYVALFPFLNKLILPRGVADLAADRPPQDTPLIASKASLAVRSELHPALQFLLLRAATEVHSRPAMFQRAGEFPAAEEIDLPLSNEARRFYRSGPNFLQRTLPFWLAEFVQRILILILPIAGIVYPLWSLAPKLYFWQKRRRLYPMYRELKSLERELRAAGPDGRSSLIGKLEDLDRRANDLSMPGMLTENTYTLRANIRALLGRIQTRQ